MSETRERGSKVFWGNNGQTAGQASKRLKKQTPKAKTPQSSMKLTDKRLRDRSKDTPQNPNSQFIALVEPKSIDMVGTSVAQVGTCVDQVGTSVAKVGDSFAAVGKYIEQAMAQSSQE